MLSCLLARNSCDGHGRDVYGAATAVKISCYGISDLASTSAGFNFAIAIHVDEINTSLALKGTSAEFDDEVAEIANYPKWGVNSAGNEGVDAWLRSFQVDRADSAGTQ